jgi:protein-tyrosine phosphatase
MIDLHCHLLPGIDDGAPDLDVSLAMARMAAEDGVRVTCCTPHIYPGLYENSGPDILRRVDRLREALAEAGIPLALSYGADTHLVPGILTGLRSGQIPTLAGSRYVLIEPSHTVRPPRFLESVFELTAAGYVAIITHPERLTWVDQHYEDFIALARGGAWLQITGGALLGRFGPKATKYAERFVGDGWCDVIASDGHSTGRRAPVLAEARARAERLIGADEARRMVIDRPEAVLANLPSAVVPRPPAHSDDDEGRRAGQGIIRRWSRRWFGGITA